MDDATVANGRTAVDLHHAERIVQERKAAAEAEPQRLYVRHAWAAATRDAIARLALSPDAPRGLARAEALLAEFGRDAAGYPDDADVRLQWARAAATVIDRLPTVEGGMERAEALLATLRGHVDRHPSEPELRIYWARAIVNILAGHARDRAAFRRGDELLAELAAATRDRPDDVALRAVWALAAFNHGKTHLEFGSKTKAAKLVAALRRAVVAHPDEGVLKLEYVRGMLGLISDYGSGKQKALEGVERLYRQMRRTVLPLDGDDLHTPATLGLMAECALWTGAYAVYARETDKAVDYFAWATLLGDPGRTAEFVGRLYVPEGVERVMAMVGDRLDAMMRERGITMPEDTL